MSQERDLRQAAKVQALVRCLCRQIQAQRAALVRQIPPGGGPIAEEARPWSGQLDHAPSFPGDSCEV